MNGSAGPEGIATRTLSQVVRGRVTDLVLALSSIPAFHELVGVEAHCFALESLADATNLRKHVISMLDRADAKTDEVERCRQLTFGVAGGGFAGTEMVAELSHFPYSALRHYPSVPIGEFRFVLIHSRDRILPEIGAELAALSTSVRCRSLARHQPGRPP